MQDSIGPFQHRLVIGYCPAHGLFPPARLPGLLHDAGTCPSSCDLSALPPSLSSVPDERDELVLGRPTRPPAPLTHPTHWIKRPSRSERGPASNAQAPYHVYSPPLGDTSACWVFFSGFEPVTHWHHAAAARRADTDEARTIPHSPVFKCHDSFLSFSPCHSILNHPATRWVNG